MKRLAIIVALALACGCRSASPKEPSQSDAALDPERAFVEKLNVNVGVATFKGASLEVILSHLSDATKADFALDPRLCWAHGPDEFLAVGTLREVTVELQKKCPEIAIEHWRNVLFVSKAGEPLLIPQTPLTLGSEWSREAPQRRLTANMIHTPLEEVVGFVRNAWTSGSNWRDFKVDPALKDRQVTASFHDPPLDRVVDVICRLTDSKLVEIQGTQGMADYAFVFKPREPAAPR